jgi:hypothetical protein
MDLKRLGAAVVDPVTIPDLVTALSRYTTATSSKPKQRRTSYVAQHPNAP